MYVRIKKGIREESQACIHLRTNNVKVLQSDSLQSATRIGKNVHGHIYSKMTIAILTMT